MNQKIIVVLSLVFFSTLVIALSNNQDVIVLKSQKWKNVPPNWEQGSNPCGDKWEGIDCVESRVTSIRLSSIGLIGQLSEDIDQLSELQILDLSYNKKLTGSLPPSIGNLKKLSCLILAGCSFSGQIPGTIGSLRELSILSLNSNRFKGYIPSSIGNLSKLTWLDLTDNNIEGAIPVSDGTTPGLDMLFHCKHFHLGQNKLTGPIPDQLFNSNMTLIHVLFDGNKLSGKIPSTLGLVHSLVVVDLSSNSFEVSNFPSWFSKLRLLKTLVLENTQLQGQIPGDLFSIPSLEIVKLKNNMLNGTFDTGISYSKHLRVIELQGNSITNFEDEDKVRGVQIILVDNPICDQTGSRLSYCNVSVSQFNSSYVTAKSCVPSLCSANKRSSPNCRCAYPYTGTLSFIAPSFSDLKDTNYYKELEKSLMTFFKQYNFSVDSVSLSNPTKDRCGYHEIRLEIFPLGRDRFTLTDISKLGFCFSNQSYKPPKPFGAFYFMGDQYEIYAGMGFLTESKRSNVRIIGAAVGGSVLVLVLLLFAVMYSFRWKRTANEGDPFGFLGTLPTGELVAIKRAKKLTAQGGMEFKTEIELLSRVHHKNLVSLVGFCFDEGEQMLVYEYVPNGTLRDSLSGKSGIMLDWRKRLEIALDTARGLAYLHVLADPPVIHRDIKSTNVLLDDHLNAKVADFGLSKLVGDSERDHVSTQVKGTMGYIDPEYYTTQRLTEKSDVYSFGVLMLELITARKPIEKGKHIVKEVRTTLDKTKDLYNLQRVLDQELVGFAARLNGFERFVDVAMRCVEDEGADRPTMSEVVKEIETIAQHPGSKLDIESTSTSVSCEELSHEEAAFHPCSEEYIDEKR